jgi:hypothetical protein
MTPRAEACGTQAGITACTRSILQGAHVGLLARISTCLQDTKAILSQLLRANYVALQEIPKQSERAAQRCHFLWTVKTDLLIKSTTDKMFKAYVRVFSCIQSH